MSEEQIPAAPLSGPYAGAWRKGYKARLEDRKTGQAPRNPYPDTRTTNGKNSITFSRSFRNAWARGYRDAYAAEGS